MNDTAIPNIEMPAEATMRQAIAAGLRPCKRCMPRSLHDRTSQLMQALTQYIDKNPGENLSLAHLAKQAHLSPAHLQRKFKAVLGVSPKAYHDAARLRRLKSGLKSGQSVLDTEKRVSACHPERTDAAGLWHADGDRVRKAYSVAVSRRG